MYINPDKLDLNFDALDVSYETGWSAEQFAEKIGDDPNRLKRVLSGEEELGLTARLATLAVLKGLGPISS